MGKILIPQEVAPEGVRMLEEAGHKVRMGTGLSKEELIREAAECDGVLLRTVEFDREILEAGKHMKIIARHGAGYNNVDLKAADRLGIWVTNTPDATTSSVAEFTLGAILAAARRTVEMNRALEKGDFFYKNNHKGMDLAGKTLGIVGLGRIGREVAKKAYFGLDMKIIAYVRRKPEDVPEYIQLADWDQVFSQADFLSLHVPLNSSTRGFVGEKEFAMMKKEAYLINCARGEVVREEELIKALQANEIQGAFLDVFEKEPPKQDNPLLSMPQVTATPHMASNTKECMEKMACQAASQIIKVLGGQRPDWPVNHPDPQGLARRQDA